MTQTDDDLRKEFTQIMLEFIEANWKVMSEEKPYTRLSYEKIAYETEKKLYGMIEAKLHKAREEERQKVLDEYTLLALADDWGDDMGTKDWYRDRFEKLAGLLKTKEEK